MTRVYKNSFRFKANRFEEWQSGRCISQGSISTEIVANVVGNTIHFNLDGIGNLKIVNAFDFDCGSPDVAILDDRVQYFVGSDLNPIVPVVCHLFNNGNIIEYVRFAMTNPDRLIEFYGNMEKLGEDDKLLDDIDRLSSKEIDALFDFIMGKWML